MAPPRHSAHTGTELGDLRTISPPYPAFGTARIGDLISHQNDRKCSTAIVG
jgi:hypothetical protein